MSAAEECLEAYPGDSPVALSGGHAHQAARRRLLALRVVRFLASQQLKDLAAEHADLAAMLERSFETERAALTAVIERTKRALRA